MSTKGQDENQQDQATELTDDDLEKTVGGTFVKSWSTSGDADDRPTEEVAFYYNRIAFSYANSPDGKS